jgi:hypothetical protein
MMWLKIIHKITRRWTPSYPPPPLHFWILDIGVNLLARILVALYVGAIGVMQGHKRK